ncbi:MAG: hypothetical protein AAF928_10190 [Myxococcota bacterium]
MTSTHDPSPARDPRAPSSGASEDAVWMVRNDEKTVGPVPWSLVKRGVEAGKIPRSAEVVHRDDFFHAGWLSVAQHFPLSEPANAEEAEKKEAADAAAAPDDEEHLPFGVGEADVTRVRAPLRSRATADDGDEAYPDDDEPVSIPKQGLLASVFGLTFG